VVDIIHALRYCCGIVIFGLTHRLVLRRDINLKTLKTEAVYYSETIVSSTTLRSDSGVYDLNFHNSEHATSYRR
jgi:hypothetical protein